MNAKGGTKRILVVDDDPNIRRFLTESLRLRGYETHSYEAAEPALAALEETRFDLALLDILLPGSNGLQLCRTLRQHPLTHDLPVIMMTAFYKQAEHVREAREQYGATDYLLKPFPLKTLHEKIDELIGPPSAAPGTERLQISGNLDETPLPRILHNLYSLQATGLLHLELNEVKKVIYIRNGYPIFVRSNMIREFLGEMLVRKGLLTADQIQTSLEVARQSNQRHGTALIEMGLITPHQLDDALHQQVLDKMLEIFSWPAGAYHFMQAREFKQSVTSIDLSPANLILQGLRDHASRSDIEKLLEPHLDCYLQQAENPLYRFQEVELTGNEQKIFDQCRGQLTLRELQERYQLSRRTLDPLIAALLSTGILIARTEPVAQDPTKDCAEELEHQTKREAFLKDYIWMMEQDYFTLFGITESDSRDTIRKAYYSLVKKYHPDRFFEQDLFPDLKDKVNALFQRISDAHETMIDPAAKARYVNDLKGLSKKAKPNLENILQAETEFQKGLVLFRVKKYAEAYEAFSRALELGPEEAEYLMYQAWSSYKTDPHDKTRLQNARQKLLSAVERNPRLSLGQLYLGYVYKAEGNLKEAQRRFERAIQGNPNCTEALREIRLMKMRQEALDKDKKGLLGKIFNK